MKYNFRIGMAVTAMVMIVCAFNAYSQQGAGKADDTAVLVGTYKLISVDGQPLPCVVTHEGKPGPEVVAGGTDFSKDGTFTSFTRFKIPDGRTIDRNLKGTFAKTDSSYTLKWEGAGQTEVKVNGSKIRMDNEGVIWESEKVEPLKK